MSKIVKIFQGPTDRPTDMTTPRSSDPELKNIIFQSDSWSRMVIFSHYLPCPPPLLGYGSNAYEFKDSILFINLKKKKLFMQLAKHKR